MFSLLFCLLLLIKKHNTNKNSKKIDMKYYILSDNFTKQKL